MSLDYFALDVGIASDPRIQRLIAQQGGLSLSVYIMLLTYIYSSQTGYELQITDDHVVAIAITLRCKTVFVHEVISACRRLGLFSDNKDPMLLTSPAILRRYRALSILSTNMHSVSCDDCSEDIPVSFPPTVADITRYLKQHNWDMIVSADEFHRYYTDLGWSIHGTPITDWRNKCDKWASRRLNPQRKSKKTSSRKEEPKPETRQAECTVSAKEFLQSQGMGSITEILNSRKK